MKHFLIGVLLIFSSLISTTFAITRSPQDNIHMEIQNRIDNFENEHCSVNDLGNKVCSFENGCYEYFNTSGIRYRHCPEDEQYNAITQYGLTDEAIAQGITCDKFFPGTTFQNPYCVCGDGYAWDNNTKLCVPFTWEKEIPTKVNEGLSTYESTVFTVIGILFILFTYLYFDDKKKGLVRHQQHLEKEKEFNKKFYEDKERKEAEEKEFWRVKPFDDRPKSITSYDEYLKHKKDFD